MISYTNENEMMLLSCSKNYDSHNFNNDLIVSNRDMKDSSNKIERYGKTQIHVIHQKWGDRRPKTIITVER